MGTTRNAYRRGVRLSLTVSPQASEAIDALVATGYHGLNRAQCAQRLLYERLRDVLPPTQGRNRR
jgi:hypothetical protein